MKLNELTTSCEIQLEFTNEKEKLYLDVTIAQVAKNGLVLNPVMHDGRAISFANNKHTVNLIYIKHEEKPLIWTNVGIANANIGGKPYVLVHSEKDSREYNRRRNFRLPLDLQGNIRDYGEVIIHDISNSGISFYLDKGGRQCKVGQTVTIGFSTRGNNFTLNVTVVRIVEEEHRFLYGCSMMSTPAVDAFIIEEQRIRLRGF